MKKVLFAALSIAISASMLMFVSCKKDKADDPTNPNVTTGIIMGKVFGGNGTTPIPMATVFVDVNGEIYLTYTNKDGNFSLEAPSGKHTMYIESGRGKIFRTMLSCDVPEDGTFTFPNGSLKLLQTANLAYIAGAYDNIQAIIDSLGYTADELTVADLDDIATLENYAGLFLNCGKQGILDAGKYANLLTFVNNGGSIYASDYAVEYLTGDGYNKGNNGHSNGGIAPKTNCIGDLGGFIDDSLLCTDKIGPATMLIAADILPADIQTYMGVTQIDVAYDLGAWEQILDYAVPPWEVLIEDATYGPLAIRMTFSSINKSANQILDQGWVTICHIPPGNPGNAHTITISINALPAHLAHGDYVGACQGDGGTVYYTTFHNHYQGFVSPDMQKMLEYFILNL